MKKLLKEELYKSTRGVTQYLCLGFAVFSAIINAVVFYFTNDALGDIGDYGGISGMMQIPSWQSFVGSSFFYASINIFVVIYVLVFICGEFKGGTLKNYCATGFSKEKIYFAKLLKVLIITFGTTTICMLASLCVAPCLLQSGTESFGQVIVMILYGLLCLLELVCFYVGMAFLVRNIGAMIGIYFGVDLIVSLLLILVSLFDNKFAEVVYKVVSYASYETQAMISTTLYSGGLEALDIVLMTIMPVVVGGLPLCLALLDFKRRDIR